MVVRSSSNVTCAVLRALDASPEPDVPNAPMRCWGSSTAVERLEPPLRYGGIKRKNVNDLLGNHAEGWCELETMTIPYEGARERALHFLTQIEYSMQSIASESSAVSSIDRLGRCQRAVFSIIPSLTALAEDLGRECRERGQVLWEMIKVLRHGMSAQLCTAVNELRAERHRARERVDALLKEVAAAKERAESMTAVALRAKVVEAELRSRLAEYGDEAARLRVANDVLKGKVKGGLQKECQDACVSTEVAACPQKEEWCCALAKLLLESAVDPCFFPSSVTPAVPRELIGALRVIAAHASVEGGELTFSGVPARDIMTCPDGSDRAVQIVCPPSCAVEVQTIDHNSIEAAVQTTVPSAKDFSVQVESLTDRSDSETSSPTASSCSMSEASSDRGAVQAEDFEADELFRSDFVRLIDFSLLNAPSSKSTDPVRETLLSHSELHTVIARLYDSLAAQLSTIGDCPRSVSLYVMAFMRRQHGVPSVIMERSLQLVRSLIHWRTPKVASSSRFSAAAAPVSGCCSTCCTLVHALLGKTPFSEFRIMLYFRQLLRRRSKYKHDTRSFGVRRSESAAALKLTYDLFSDDVADQVVAAIKDADVWVVQECVRRPSQYKSPIVQSELDSRLIQALMEGWEKKLGSFSGHQVNSIEEAAIAFMNADGDYTGLLRHTACVVAAGSDISWSFMADDGPAYVGFIDFSMEVGMRRATLSPAEGGGNSSAISEFVVEALITLGLEGHANSLQRSADPRAEHTGRQYRSRLGALRRCLADGQDSAAVAETISLLASYVSIENSQAAGAPSVLTQDLQKVIAGVLRPLLESAKATKVFLLHDRTESGVPTEGNGLAAQTPARRGHRRGTQ